MKVIELIHTDPPEVFLQKHFNAVSDYGAHSVKLLARSRGKAGASSTDQNCSVSFLPNFNYLSTGRKLLKLRYVFNSFRYFVRTRNVRKAVMLGFLRKQGPDLIHFHTVSLARTYCWLIGEMGIPFTVSVRGSDIAIRPLKSKNYSNEVIAAIELCAGVHTVARSLLEGNRVLEIESEKVKPIFTPIFKTVPRLTPKNFNGTEIRFLTVCRLHWKKGLINLLLMIVRLDKLCADSQIHLSIVGSGREKDLLMDIVEKLGISDLVHFVGRVENAQLTLHYQAADYYIQSSFNEGLSNSIAEAMLQGLVVFATDVGGTSDVIDDGKTGFLLPGFNPKDWAERISEILQSDKLHGVAKLAHSLACDLFSCQTHAEQFSSFFDSAQHAFHEKSIAKISVKKNIWSNIPPRPTKNAPRIIIVDDGISSRSCLDVFLSILDSSWFSNNSASLLVPLQGHDSENLRLISALREFYSQVVFYEDLPDFSKQTDSIICITDSSWAVIFAEGGNRPLVDTLEVMEKIVDVNK